MELAEKFQKVEVVSNASKVLQISLLSWSIYLQLRSCLDGGGEDVS